MKTKQVDVVIKNQKNEEIFRKDNFVVPESWSDTAAFIAANKYASANENSVIDTIDRIVKQITKWGIEQSYFNKTDEVTYIQAEKFMDDLKDILINQRAAFNSPVWFNIGVKEYLPQSSACFILSVDDTIEDILNHTVREGLIFRNGSGAGVNVSKLRAKGELLSNKGTSSGPISFMKSWDANAGSVKSGGKTRRSAKLVCMDVDHPDINEFITCKKIEEDKAKILINNGIDPQEAYATVAFQNTNHSVRVTNDFMRAVEEDRDWTLIGRHAKTKPIVVKAKDILMKAAKIAWTCGDPGIMFDNRINEDNPVPSIDRIRSSNPCGEYNAIDNTSCNLASLNLVKYLTEENIFDEELFERDIKILITAMDIIIEPSYYPTEEVRNNTIKTRALGLGYANLGAFLIKKKIPYDSPKAYEEVRKITQLMTVYAFKQSIVLGKKLGSFPLFAENTDRVNEIISNITGRKVGPTDYCRNSQVTLLAPTGTISLLMDCDTSGIEPLFSLKTIKNLSGGGKLELIPKCVEEFIAQEGNYNSEILKTANEIDWRDHINIMSAAQKYLSGAISKTINMPNDCTADDVFDAYMMAWKKGLKSITIYRDGSKGMQPLTSKNKEDKEEEQEEVWTAVRRRLPDTRQSITHKFNISGFEGYITAGLYEDGMPGELFIRAQKQGSTISGLLDSFAISISLALQYGVPLESLIDKFTDTRFEPAGFTRNEDIRMVTSVIDYVFRWLEKEFIDEEEEYLNDEEIADRPSIPHIMKKISFDGPPCNQCGSVTGRSGSCYVCPSCGETTGCS